MKKEVTDIQDVRVELDEDDRELMRMFPRRREAALDEMMLVRKGERIYLLRKADVARRRKILDGIVWTLIGCACAMYLIMAVMCAIAGNGRGGVYLLMFELLLFPYIAKVPKDVQGGVHP